jgi:hypothetical protein
MAEHPTFWEDIFPLFTDGDIACMRGVNDTLLASINWWKGEGNCELAIEMLESKEMPLGGPPGTLIRSNCSRTGKSLAFQKVLVRRSSRGSAMRRGRLFTCPALLAVTVAAAVVCTWIHVYAQPAAPATSLPDAIPLAPPDANQPAIDRFSWQTFVALNRPAMLDGQGRPVRDDTFPNGKPDLAKPLAAPGPRVWEGLKADHELFRHGGTQPVAWDRYDNHLPCAAGPMAERSGEKILTLVSEGTSMQEGINQAMAGPLIDRFGRYVHYEVRQNKAYYDFVKTNKFYLRDILDKQHRWPRKMVQLPTSDPDGKAYGSLEVKAAWRVLDPPEKDATARRYYSTWASVPDPVTGKCGPKQRVALVGLHIIQKVKGFNSWLWATFEHVDNVPCKYSDMSTCPSVPPDHYAFNAKDQTLDQNASGNRGFWPRVWTKPKLGEKWKPIDPQKLPPEPIAKEDRINAVRMLQSGNPQPRRTTSFMRKTA